MNKIKIEVYEVLTDVSQNLEGIENFIKQRKYVNKRKDLLKKYFSFIYFLCFQCYSMMLTCPSHEKQLFAIAM